MTFGRIKQQNPRVLGCSQRYQPKKPAVLDCETLALTQGRRGDPA